MASLDEFAKRIRKHGEQIAVNANKEVIKVGITSRVWIAGNTHINIITFDKSVNAPIFYKRNFTICEYAHCAREKVLRDKMLW